jgi:hypothetical protein
MVFLRSMWLRLQAPVREPGSVEVITLAALSPATHRDFDGHEIAVKLLMPPVLSRVRCQAELPPVGCREATAATIPLEVNPSAAQKDPDAQETSCSPRTPTVRDVHGPPAGLVEVKTCPPAKSVAAQKDWDRQEIPFRYDVQKKTEHGSTGVVLHAPAPPAGSVEVNTYPW